MSVSNQISHIFKLLKNSVILCIFGIFFSLEHYISKIHAWTIEPNFLGLHSGSAKILLVALSKSLNLSVLQPLLCKIEILVPTKDC